MSPSPTLGRHFLIELSACAPDALTDPGFVECALLDAARAAGATILGHHVHRFEPHGVSAVVVIAESHLSIHTWPEHAYAAADLFTCGAQMTPEEGIAVLRSAFRCGRCVVTEVARGPDGAGPAAPLP